MRFLLNLFCAVSLAYAQTLEIDKAVVTRADILKATLKWNDSLGGKGTLRLKWTGSFGRTANEESQFVGVNRTSLDFRLPLKRAVAFYRQPCCSRRASSGNTRSHGRMTGSCACTQQTLRVQPGRYYGRFPWRRTWGPASIHSRHVTSLPGSRPSVLWKSADAPYCRNETAD